jgi:hypothetical protein
MNLGLGNREIPFLPQPPPLSMSMEILLRVVEYVQF